MMDWDKLRIFHAVAEAGSFTHAGEQLNLSSEIGIHLILFVSVHRFNDRGMKGNSFWKILFQSL